VRDATITLPGLLSVCPGCSSFWLPKDDNVRFKFFLEPVFLVFIASQLSVAGEQVYRKVRTKRFL
jgi:hypothetical protein